jgi:hypothetical protein
LRLEDGPGTGANFAVLNGNASDSDAGRGKAKVVDSNAEAVIRRLTKCMRIGTTSVRVIVKGVVQMRN